MGTRIQMIGNNEAYKGARTHLEEGKKGWIKGLNSAEELLFGGVNECQ